MSRARLWMLSSVFALVSAGLVASGAPDGQGGRPSVPAGLAAPAGQPRQYTGASIDIDFQGTDLRTVLRVLAETGGINLVIDPTVPTDAKVDLKLTQVPWDQAFDIVLRTSGLQFEVDGTVVRVVSSKALQAEDEARQKQLVARADLQAAQNKRPRTFTLNYAKGDDIEKVLRSLSKYAETHFDARTNTLIVRDLPDQLNADADLIAQLDQPQPQVEIEAQIVETDHNSARALGIQWGATGRAAPELGNTTALAFPNSASLSPAVSLPVTAATSTVGLSLGAINGALKIDVALSALQTKGLLKILSSPKVTTQNNKEAEVATGFQVPFQTIANNTVVIQFRDAALKLTVLPQVTSAGTVIMRINLSNDFPDFSQTVNGNPSINTQRASTEVQVGDGVTTVIGGIKQSKDTSQNDRTPGLGNVPLLGWLFRRDTTSSKDQELLIFVTPRIIRGLP